MDGFNASALTLPRLDHVPARPVIDEGAEGLQEMAVALVHAGLLTAADLDAHRNLRKAMDSAVTNWLTPYDDAFQVFKGVDYAYTNRLELESYEDESLLKKKPAAFVVTCDQQREAYYIDKTATALQEKVPGLGHDLMILFQQASTCGLGLFTPNSGEGAAQYCFWRGEMDETEIAKEFLYEAEGDDAYRAFDKLPRAEQAAKIKEICDINEIVTRAELDAITPKWAHTLPSRCWWGGAVPSFPKLSGKFAKVMTAANELAEQLRTVRRKYLRHGRDRESSALPNDRHLLRATTDLSAPALLRWSYEDYIPRVLDDMFQDAMNSGDQDYYITGAVCFDPLDPADCRQARARFEALLETSALTDRLVRVATYPDK